jgi:hypothetical protein
VSGEGTEQLCDLVIKYLKDNIVDLCDLIKSVIGDIEQAIVTANGDVLSKVTAAKILGGIEEGLRMLEDAALCDEYRDVATNAMLDAVGVLLRVLYDLKAGRPLEEKERELWDFQLMLRLRALGRLPLCCGKKGEGSGQV